LSGLGKSSEIGMVKVDDTMLEIMMDKDLSQKGGDDLWI
jgi:hypothetical protein